MNGMITEERRGKKRVVDVGAGTKLGDVY